MPLFSRSDGKLVKNESPVRRIMPYLMRGRNESVVYHAARYDLTRTLPWLQQQNADGKKVTLFHLMLHAFTRAIYERPGLNRFVSGGHIYQRDQVSVAFAAKKQFADDAPIMTVKLNMGGDDTFAQVVERVSGSVSGARGGKTNKAVDTELKLALALPGLITSLVMSFIRWLDRVNLLPGSMIANDPLYSSLFVANLGSIGIDDVYHHLYEYGTTSLFAAIGRVEKGVFVDENGVPVVRDAVKVSWTFDERINDGFYCASSLKIAQKIVEDPATWVR
jgi:hypothetical protein